MGKIIVAAVCLLIFSQKAFSQNGAPTANIDIAVAVEDAPSPLLLLNNDTDPDGDPLTAHVLLGPFNGTIDSLFGIWFYTGNPNYNGLDFFVYEACDPSGACSQSFCFITITPVNDPPIAKDDNATTDEDVSLTMNVQVNDSDVDGDAMTTQLNVQPLHGTATVNADNTITYVPASNYNGADQFGYHVCDSSNACGAAQVNITVIPVNDPPTAVNDTVTGDLTSGTVVPVLNNDFDVDGDNIHLQFVNKPVHGVVSAENSESFVYTSERGVLGEDSFSYEICDNANPSLCDTALVFMLPGFNAGSDIDVSIPQGFSPNGDGINDNFVIVNVAAYPENVLTIFNRWGNQVYEMKGYDNSWNGDSEKGEHLPDGYYFYNFDPGPQRASVSAWLVIKR